MKVSRILLCLGLALTVGACDAAKPPATLEELVSRAEGDDPAAVASLVDRLGTRSDTDTVGRVYRLLLERGTLAPEAIRAGWRAEDPSVREHALAIGANLKLAGIEDAALAALADPGFSRGHAAAWALGELGDGAAIPALVEAVVSGEPLLKARESVRALAKLGEPGVAALAARAGELSGARKGFALRVLGESRLVAVKPVLLAGLADPESRVDAVWALGTMGKVGEPADLVAYLSDPDWRVRVEASRAVGLLDDHRADPVLDRMREQDPVAAAREWAARGLSLLRGEPQQYCHPDAGWQTPDSLYH